MKIELNNDDVVSMKSEYSVIGSNLFKLGWFKGGLERISGALSKWISDGVDCEILSVNGGGWQKGKLHLRLEFIPDEPDPPTPSDLVLSPNSDQQ
jgi:hypothetical protein